MLIKNITDQAISDAFGDERAECFKLILPSLLLLMFDM